MFGECPCCKNWIELTKHHDKEIDEIIMICRNCHDIIEEYIKAQQKTKDHK